MARSAIGSSRRKAPPVRAKVHVRRGDRVRVIRGNFAGTEGTVLRVITDQNKVVVEGVNRRTKHARPTQENPQGGRITFEAPIDASNVMVIDPSSGEPTRVRRQIAKNGTKERVAAKSGSAIPRPKN